MQRTNSEYGPPYLALCHVTFFLSSEISYKKIEKSQYIFFLYFCSVA